MKNKYLYNQKNKQDLLKKLSNESFQRVTCSFYRYVSLNRLNELRDSLFLDWNKLNILGRVYLAKEGVNAQLSIPEQNLELFKVSLNTKRSFLNMHLKFAIQEGLSFLKLVIKIKEELFTRKKSTQSFTVFQ